MIKHLSSILILFLSCLSLTVTGSALDISDDVPITVPIISPDDLQSALDDQTADIVSAIDDLTSVIQDNDSASSIIDSGVASFVADSSLGHLTFYLPAGSVSNPFIISSSGIALNGTSGTLYLYSEDYPTYTISASRFSGFQYRQSTSASYHDLNLRNVEFLASAPSGSGSFDYLPIIFELVTALSVLLLLLFKFQEVIGK